MGETFSFCVVFIYMEIAYIYTLSDPRNKLVRYVGKTKNTKMRLNNHMNRRHNDKTHKTNWIESLKKMKTKPLFEIIDEVPVEEWKYWEKFWIEMMIVWGFSLVNHTTGGDGLTYGNQTSFKKGTIPWNKGIANEFICEICGKSFKAPASSKRRFCGISCTSEFKSKNPNSGNFKTCHNSWNKGLNIDVGNKSKTILQFDKKGNFINEYKNCRVASEKYDCNPEAIRNCCHDKTKSSNGYVWKYK